jgi:NAD(P)-dependent dehydrogenase (short-subunit alcohol dehydrogenase family)
MGDRFKGKVAVVTGAGRGIGRGIAHLLAAEGAKVVVNDLGGGTGGGGGDKSVAEAVVQEIKKLGGTAVANGDSVGSMAGGERIIKTALDTWGKLDILINVAGILRDRMIFNMTEEEWDIIQQVHLKGHFATIKPASILMRQQRGGRIVNFSSTSGMYGNSGQANYGAAKSGIVGLTRVVARDLGRYGVTCNAICPAAATRLTATVPEDTAAIRARAGIQAAGRSTTNTQAEVQRLREPQPGVNHPDDIAPWVAYLCTDQAANINGKTFYVGGGRVSLLCDEVPLRVMWKPTGYWTPQEIAQLFPQTFGMDLVNPAPALPPKE